MAQSFAPDRLYPRITKLDDEREIQVYQSEVGDVGCVVWDAAIVLAKLYEHISGLCENDERIRDPGENQNQNESSEEIKVDLQMVLANLKAVVQACNQTHGDHQVVELGSGTGYAGIVAACHGAQVTITDLPEFVDLMKYNINKNDEIIKERGGMCSAKELVWGTTPVPLSDGDGKVDLILLADCIYYEESLKPLVQTLVDLSTSKTLTLCCHEERTTDNKPRLQRLFFEEMGRHFNIVKVPIMHQHPTYSSEDIHIHIFQLSNQSPA